jgi:glucokinase
MNDTNTRYVLAGDIGGTKTYVGLYEIGRGAAGAAGGPVLYPVRDARIENAGHSGLEGIITDFLRDGEAARVKAAAFGIACPVGGNRCRFTNLDWVVDGEAIARDFGIPEVSLINDLVATAWGVDLLETNDLRQLKGGSEIEGNAGLIAAGTGLGMAHLIWDGSSHRPSPSEGGHADFAPTGDLQMELLKYLAGRFGHVSYERILSGPGLKNLFDFFVERGGAPVPARLAETFARPGADAAAIIVAEATRAGISVLEDGLFVESFVDKGRFRELLERIPVRVIMNDRTALYGAAANAATLASGGAGGVVRMVRD